MKKNVIMIAIIAVGLYNKVQPGYGSMWKRSLQRHEDLESGRRALIGMGVGAAALVATVAAANFHASFFPESPEAKAINKRKKALTTLASIRNILKIIKKEQPTGSLQNKDDIQFAMKNISTSEGDLKTIEAMVNVIETLENDIAKDISNDTEKLKKRAERKKEEHGRNGGKESGTLKRI